MRGFSLVELSIVLVILGLLTGGVLAGQHLIRSAELLGVTNEYTSHQSAVEVFNDQYRAIPGDMHNATRYWGRQVADGWCTTTTGAAVTATGTCDGSGNGSFPFGAAQAEESGESYQFWRQLALAGLVRGTYSGLAGPTASNHDTTANNYVSKLGTSVLWAVRSWDGGASSSAFAHPYGNAFWLGRASTLWNAGPALTTVEARNIDTKLDDGYATSGKIWAVRWNTCTPSADGNDYKDYSLELTGLRCGLVFKQSF